MAKRRCHYEEEDFEESEFDAGGEHLKVTPRHLLTGDLISEGAGGNGPLSYGVDPAPDQK